MSVYIRHSATFVNKITNINNCQPVPTVTVMENITETYIQLVNQKEDSDDDLSNIHLKNIHH